MPETRRVLMRVFAPAPQATVPLTIVLREAHKAQCEMKNNLINATSAFVLNRVSHPTSQNGTSSQSLGLVQDRSVTPGGPIGIVIRHSQHRHADSEYKVSVLWLDRSVLRANCACETMLTKHDGGSMESV